MAQVVNLWQTNPGTNLMINSFINGAHNGYESNTAALWLNIMAECIGICGRGVQNNSPIYIFSHEFPHTNNHRTDLVISRVRANDEANMVRAFGNPFIALEYKTAGCNANDWQTAQNQLLELFQHLVAPLRNFNALGQVIDWNHFPDYKLFGIAAAGNEALIHEYQFTAGQANQTRGTWALRRMTGYTVPGPPGQQRQVRQMPLGAQIAPNVQALPRALNLATPNDIVILRDVLNYMKWEGPN